METEEFYRLICLTFGACELSTEEMDNIILLICNSFNESNDCVYLRDR